MRPGASPERVTRHPSSVSPARVLTTPSRLGFSASAVADAPGAPSADGARPPRGVRSTDEVVQAAWWWVATVVLPPRRGVGKVKERDGYTCQNPECRRTSIRVEAHHERPRSLGGDDSQENLICACRPCHLRGLHTGTADKPARITTEKTTVDDTPAILWTYAGGRQTLQLRGELPGGRAPPRCVTGPADG